MNSIMQLIRPFRKYELLALFRLNDLVGLRVYEFPTMRLARSYRCYFCYTSDNGHYLNTKSCSYARQYDTLSRSTRAYGRERSARPGDRRLDRRQARPLGQSAYQHDLRAHDWRLSCCSQDAGLDLD